MTIVALVLALLASGCKSPTAPDAALGKPFTLKVGEAATLPDGARLRFDRLVADSRCPIDAICITAGDATIAVTFTRTNESRELHTEPAKSQISYANYTIKLTELQPYPQASNPRKPEDYVATFVVQSQ